jgi:hypothetical protein
MTFKPAGFEGSRVPAPPTIRGLRRPVLTRRDCGMRVHLNDDEYLGDLLAFVRGVGCVAYAIGSDRLDVVVPDSKTERAARLDLAAYLEVWRQLHPTAHVVVIAE